MLFPSSIQYRTIPGYDGFLAGEDGTIWSHWESAGPGRKPGVWHELYQHIQTHPRTGRQWITVNIRGDKDTKKRHPPTKKVHHLILLAFVGPCPPGQRCRHLDGDSLNNEATNLCWGTHEEDQDDKRRHGTFKPPRIKIGEENNSAKLTEQDVLDIRADYATGKWGYRTLAKRHGVRFGTIRQIVQRQIWRHI